MAKNKLMYVCDQCGYESVQWIGKCPSCNAWNSFKEIRVAPVSSKKNTVSIASSFQGNTSSVKPLLSVKAAQQQRIDTGDSELRSGLVSRSLSARSLI